ncbi:MAG: acyltransferase [Candidatus Eisenbacteria bacterium]|uniref:Acyltransferase n=1 Tax=Eiseniibacteriota bacterium TaxID=2212470 RepID=A0A956NA74_UNCEI|nr:acyltransferase [Candidatus Eisenbacteria bacterium]
MPPSIVTGIVMTLLMAAHSAFWLAILYVFALIRFLLPFRPVRRECAKILVRIAQGWVTSDRFLMDHVIRTKRFASIPEGLDPEKSYLLCSNHRSWIDPLFIAVSLQKHVPFFRFFAKRGLIWLPFFGVAFWALDFPFMRRYSKEHLERNPEDRGKDLETARQLSEKFRRMPTTVVNFSEGTRFTRRKHEAQDSPYRHLLKPRAGGSAYVISAMGDRLAGVVDCTIVYPTETTNFGDFLCGRIPWMALDVKLRELPPRFLEGNYLDDPVHRDEVQAWMRDLWDEKDETIARILREHGEASRE